MEIKRVVHNQPARDRQNISLEQYVLIRCSTHLIPHACLALRSHLNLAPALHGTATRWARLLLSQRAAAWCSAGVDQLRKFDRVMWYGLHLVKSIGTAQRQPRR